MKEPFLLGFWITAFAVWLKRITSWQTFIVTSKLEAKVKDLCAKVIKAEGEELRVILSRLREALHEQTQRARDMVAEQKRRAAGPPE